MSTDRQILRIALPSIATNVTVPLLALADTAITGHLGGAVYLGAIAVGTTFFSLAYWLFGFLRMSTGAMTAQAFGAGRTDETQQALLRGLGFAAAASLLIVVLQRPLVALFLQVMPATPEVAELARQYFAILVWGAPAVLGLYCFTGWFLGMQQARLPMLIAVGQNVVNIGASLLLALGLDWKVAGVAAGTLVAQWGGLVAAVVLWRRGCGRTAPLRSLWRGAWERSALRCFLSMNRDIFLRTACLLAVTTYFTARGAARGDLVLATNALLLQFFYLYSYVMDGFAYAGEALGGSSYGAADAAGFGRLARRLFVWGLGLAAAFTAVYALGGGLIVALLTDEADVRALAASYLPWAVAIPACGMAAFLLDGLCIGTSSTRPMLLATAGGAVAFFALEHALGPAWGNHALWLAFVIYLLLRGVIEAAALPAIRQKIVHLQEPSLPSRPARDSGGPTA